jgi:hypothetical protein
MDLPPTRLQSTQRITAPPPHKGPRARTLRSHLDGVLRWFDSRLTNALLEGFSSLVQSAKAAARGYRNPFYMSLVIYLRLGKLDLKWTPSTRAVSI